MNKDTKCKNCRCREINFSRSKNLCDVCLDRTGKYYRIHKKELLEKQHKRTAEMKAKRILSGRCTTCSDGIITPPSTRFCPSCLEKSRISNRKQQANRSKEAKNRRNENDKKRRLNNPEKFKEYERGYYRLHPEKYTLAPINRRARKRKAEGNFTQKEWLDVLGKYNGKCLCCGTEKDIEKDHVVPLSRGGTNYISNIQPLCGTCNNRKMRKIIDFRPFGRAILDWT